MSKQEDEINKLNMLVKVRLAPSKIHGVGVFAITDIPRGVRLHLGLFPQKFDLSYGNFNKLFPEVRELLLERWPNIVNGSSFLYPETNVVAYMNHSDKPNYDAINDVTLSSIKKGEEIVENYRLIPNYEKVYKWLVDT